MNESLPKANAAIGIDWAGLGALVEGQFQAHVLGLVAQTLGLVSATLLPSWLANHQIAVDAFCALHDFESALIVLNRLSPLMGDFIDETKDASDDQRKPVVDVFLRLCSHIGDLSPLWGVVDHPHQRLIQMHRRCTKLFPSG